MYTLINGSGKLKNSNSEYFLRYISNGLEKCNYFNLRNSNYKEIILSIKKSDSIVLAFPLYADSPSSLTLSLLDYLYDSKIDINANLYVIINCGFREPEHNITALNIIKNWCKKMNISFYGSVLIGTGEVAGDSKYRFISKKIFKDLDDLKYCIKNNEKMGDRIHTVSLLNNFMFCTIAKHNWNKQAKTNHLKVKDIKRK